jgi:hypothetical protein
MSYFVFCTFDLKHATSEDYKTAYTDLAAIGLKKVIVSDHSKNIVIPTTAVAGEFTARARVMYARLPCRVGRIERTCRPIGPSPSTSSSRLSPPPLPLTRPDREHVLRRQTQAVLPRPRPLPAHAESPSPVARAHQQSLPPVARNSVLRDVNRARLLLGLVVFRAFPSPPPLCRTRRSYCRKTTGACQNAALCPSGSNTLI